MRKYIVLALLVTVFFSCQKKWETETVLPENKLMENLNVPESFDWKLTQKVTIEANYLPAGQVINITSVDGKVSYYKGLGEGKPLSLQLPKTIKELSVNGQLITFFGQKSVHSGQEANATDVTFGNPIVFNNAFSYSSTALALDNQRFLLTYGKGWFGPLVARVGTVSGDNIVYGPEYQVPGNNWAYYNTASNMALIDHERVLYAYKAYPNGGVMIITVVGNSVSFGTPALSYHVINYPTVALLDNNKFVFSVNGDGNSYLYGFIGTINGTSVSLGTERGIFYHNNSSAHRIDGMRALYAQQNLISGKWVPEAMMVYNDWDGFSIPARITISQANSHYPMLDIIDGNHFVYAYADAEDGTKGKVVLGNYTTDALTSGSPVVFSNNPIDNGLYLGKIDATTFLLIYGTVSGGAYKTNYKVGYISGGNITLGSEKILMNNRKAHGSFILLGGNRILATIEDMTNNSSIVRGLNFLSNALISDADGDGIADDQDDYPNDPLRAFDNYYPAAGYGSLAYEDLWPGKGDYDFNDLVVDYRFHTVTNAQNKVVDIKATFASKASGAALENGFGFGLPNASANLSSDPANITVTGSKINHNYIVLNAHGHEDGQSKPVVIVHDNIFNLLPHPGIGLGVNTVEWAPFVAFDTTVITIVPSTADLVFLIFNLGSWNPFLIVNKERGHECTCPTIRPQTLLTLSGLGCGRTTVARLLAAPIKP
jgi:LruC domain-containing protein